ncbi:LutC/YkgG family protein [Pleomorphovibrio marinus]|uniref:LutC/YkgG family protein n=1 Tax=Pleomorphovibrio marinus TaxID=2164132 RepID=UPI000E0B3F6D|nr:LUD domain-containing protein [Pleomorphovibrio marinus]
MSSRSEILGKIAKNKPQPTPLPELLAFGDTWNNGDLIEQFKESSALNGGKTILVKSREEIGSYLESSFDPGKQTISLSKSFKGNLDCDSIRDPHDLEKVELAILEGTYGVAENAAIWLPEENLQHRVLPFIAQHLVVILDAKNLLPDMHEVYKKVDVSAPDYGVFIAGPSKTADIEQSLVIGAHGPRSMTVFIIADE